MTIHHDSVKHPGESVSRSAAAAEEIERFQRAAASLRDEAELHLLDSVRGPRGERITLAAALEQEEALRSKVEVAVSLEDHRHDRSRPWQRRIVLLAPVLDFPLFLWFASSVFNVPWQGDPLGVELAVSVTVAVFATLVLAVALHNIGSGLRPFKTEQRELHWRPLPTSARIRLSCTLVLLWLVAVVMFARIYLEADASGAGGTMAVALALLVAALSAVANALVAWVPFTDGSTDTDHLDHYAAATGPPLARCMSMLRAAGQYDAKASVLHLRLERAPHGVPTAPSGTPSLGISQPQILADRSQPSQDRLSAEEGSTDNPAPMS